MTEPNTPGTDPSEWGPKPADTVTPHRQSLLVMEHLSRDQLAAYLRSSGLSAGATREEAALHFAQHRVAALQEAAAFRERTQKWERTRRRQKVRGFRHDVPSPALPPEAAAELDSGQQVGDAAGRAWQRLSTWSGIAGFALGWAFLITGVMGVVPGLQVLLLVSCACLVGSLVLMAVVAPALYARGQRASRTALFEWAVHRPGQLERGLPGLHQRIDEDATGGSAFCLHLLSLGVGGFCGFMGLVMIPVALFDNRATTWQITGILLAIAAVMLLTPRLVILWSRWVRDRNDEVDEAVSWVYAAALPQGPHA